MGGGWRPLLGNCSYVLNWNNFTILELKVIIRSLWGLLSVSQRSKQEDRLTNSVDVRVIQIIIVLGRFRLEPEVIVQHIVDGTQNNVERQVQLMHSRNVFRAVSLGFGTFGSSGLWTSNVLPSTPVSVPLDQLDSHSLCYVVQLSRDSLCINVLTGVHPLSQQHRT